MAFKNIDMYGNEIKYPVVVKTTSSEKRYLQWYKRTVQRGIDIMSDVSNLPNNCTYIVDKTHFNFYVMHDKEAKIRNKKAINNFTVSHF